MYSQVILGVLMEVWAYKKLRPLLKDGEVIKKAFKDYPEFARMDVDRMKRYRNRFYLFLVAPLVALKFIIGWGSLAILWMWCCFCMLFYKKGEPVNPNSWSYRSIQLGNHIVGRIGMAMFGCPWGIHEEKTKVDYSAYLGPDWKPSYKNTGTIIVNHTVFMDTLIM